MPLPTSLSFTPEKIEQKQSIIERLFAWITLYGKKIVIATEAIVIISLLIQVYLTREVNRINKSIEDGRKFIVDSKDLENKFRIYSADIGFIKKTKLESSEWSTQASKILNQVSEKNGIFINSVELTTQKITLEGTSETSQDFAFLIQSFLSEKNVAKLIVNGSSYQRDTKKYSFNLAIVRR